MSLLLNNVTEPVSDKLLTLQVRVRLGWFYVPVTLTGKITELFSLHDQTEPNCVILFTIPSGPRSSFYFNDSSQLINPKLKYNPLPSLVLSLSRQTWKTIHPILCYSVILTLVT